MSTLKFRVAAAGFLAVLSSAGFCNAQTIRTVRAAGPGAAPPWNTATTNLASAINNAVSGDQVWIAEGTYPTTQTMTIPSGVKVYGGFAGIETSIDQRPADPLASRTRITGAASGPPPFVGPALRFNGASAATLLDRVTISGGRGFNGATEFGGVALHVLASAARVNDCVFDDHVGNFGPTANPSVLGGLPGGAVSIGLGSTPEFTNCVFSNNRGAVPSVGDGCSGGNARSNNRPGGNGGAVASLNSSPTFINCAFIGNRAGNGADGDSCVIVSGAGGPGGSGGAYWASNSTSTFRNCRFENNQAGGGGRGGTFNSNAAVNGAGGDGGGIAVQGGSLRIESSTFVSNLGGNGGSHFSTNPDAYGGPGAVGGRGGAVFAGSLTPTVIVNSVFSANSGGNGGAGMISGFNCGNNGGNAGTGGAVAASSTLDLVNCTIVNSTPGLPGAGAAQSPFCTFGPPCCVPGAAGAPGVGAVAALSATDLATITNTIVWNSGAEPFSGTITVQRSVVPAGTPGVGNIFNDPLFATVSTTDFRLSAASPCIDAGSNPAFLAVAPSVTTDIAGSLRFIDRPATPDTGDGAPPLIDIGASEFRCPGDFNGSGTDTIQDIYDFISAFFAQSPAADVNASGTVSVQDLFDFLAGYFAGC